MSILSAIFLSVCSLALQFSLMAQTTDERWEMLKSGDLTAPKRSEDQKLDKKQALIGTERLLSLIDEQGNKLEQLIGSKMAKGLTEQAIRLQTHLQTVDQALRSFTEADERQQWIALTEHTYQQIAQLITLIQAGGEENALDYAALENAYAPLKANLAAIGKFIAQYRTIPIPIE